jgi:hypothetical protein
VEGGRIARRELDEMVWAIDRLKIVCVPFSYAREPQRTQPSSKRQGSVSQKVSSRGWSIFGESASSSLTWLFPPDSARRTWHIGRGTSPEQHQFHGSSSQQIIEMEIEARLPNGGFYKAYVQSVNPDGLQVTFDNESAFLFIFYCIRLSFARVFSIVLSPSLRR